MILTAWLNGLFFAKELTTGEWLSQYIAQTWTWVTQGIIFGTSKSSNQRHHNNSDDDTRIHNSNIYTGEAPHA